MARQGKVWSRHGALWLAAIWHLFYLRVTSAGLAANRECERQYEVICGGNNLESRLFRWRMRCWQQNTIRTTFFLSCPRWTHRYICNKPVTHQTHPKQDWLHASFLFAKTKKSRLYSTVHTSVGLAVLRYVISEQCCCCLLGANNP